MPKLTQCSREENTRKCREYRNRNREAVRIYQKDYQRRWLADPINSRVHHLRVLANCIAKQMQKTSRKYPFSPETGLAIIKLYGQRQNRDDCIDHIVPIRSFVEFNIETPVDVIFNPFNLEIVTRAENTSRGKTAITPRQIDVAQKLELMYPEHLHGFTEWLQSNKETRDEA